MIPTQLIKQIETPLKWNWLFQNVESRVVFACGGASGSKPSARQKVLEYASKQFPEFLFFQAEDAFSQLIPGKDEDLLTLEIRMLEYADCVMIILESVGAIAELGAFSANDAVAKTILLINDKKHENDKSFLQLGPVAKINLVSDFKPTIYTQFDRILHSTAEIKKRLDSISRSRRKRVPYLSLVDLSTLNSKVRLFVLLDIVAVFSPIRRDELQQMWKDVFGDVSKVGLDIAMLKALGFISVESGHLVRLPRKPTYFFSFLRTDLDHVRSRVLLHYFRKDRRRADLMDAIMIKHV